MISHNVDWVALLCEEAGRYCWIKGRLEKAGSKGKWLQRLKCQALRNLRDIIVESDGVMIARGDLGVEPIEVPLIQKDIIKKCLHRAKPVIVATQMMESMIDRTKPNRKVRLPMWRMQFLKALMR